MTTSLPEQMACAMWRGVDDMRLERHPVPTPTGREVLIRVAACGICATDLHLLDGSIPLYTPPRVLGHEMSGVVVAVGPDAQSIQVGAAVAIDPNVSCGSCFYCQEALPYMCPRRTSMIGGFAEYLRVPEQTVYPLPPGIPVEYGEIGRASCRERVEMSGVGGSGIERASTIKT